MGIFGQKETPTGDFPNAKQVAAFFIKPHKEWRGNSETPIPVIEVTLNPFNNTIPLKADARVGFSNGETRPGLPVTFILNDESLAEVATDEFGIACLRRDLPAGLFQVTATDMAPPENELVARIKGQTREASIKIFAFNAWCGIRIWEQGWKWAQHAPTRDGYYHRVDALNLTVEVHLPPLPRSCLRDLDLSFGLQLSRPGWRGNIAITRLINPSPGQNSLTFLLPNYYLDRSEWPRGTYNLRYGDLEVVSINWPALFGDNHTHKLSCYGDQD